MNKTIFGLHTGQVKKQITYREAKNIELLFGNSFPNEQQACSQFFKDGISKFWIEVITNKVGKQYFLNLQINFAKASSIGEYCLMPYTLSNIRKVRTKITKILKQLKLDDRNSDFGNWKVERFDEAFDTEVSLTETYMSLLDKSLDVNAYKKQCKRVPFIPANPNVCESIRFENASYTYNVYNKQAELLNKGITITPEILQEVKNIIRVERQNKKSAIKQLLKTGLFKDLELASVRNAILKALIDDIEVFWGKGDYYSSRELNAEFNTNTDVMQLVPKIAKFTENSIEIESDLYTPEVKQILQDYGIMPVGINKDDAHHNKVYKLTGLYNIVTNAYAKPNKRAYNVFPIPHLCSDGRLKAAITFHMVNDTRKQPVSIAKSSLDAYEKTVFDELQRVYVTNVKHHCTIAPIPELIDKSSDDILRFYQVVKTKIIKEEATRFIKLMNIKENKKIKEKY